jgi:hypothetical protein
MTYDASVAPAFAESTDRRVQRHQRLITCTSHSACMVLLQQQRAASGILQPDGVNDTVIPPVFASRCQRTRGRLPSSSALRKTNNKP